MRRTVVILVAVVVVLLGGGVWLLSQSATSGSEGKYDTFAQCLAEKKLTMYGAYWCPHCQNEKKAFGNSFQYVPYIECTRETKLCLEKGIQGYPTWITADGNKYEGEQGLDGLARLSGCSLPD